MDLFTTSLDDLLKVQVELVSPGHAHAYTHVYTHTYFVSDALKTASTKQINVNLL